MNLGQFLARLAYAALAGVIAFLVVFGIGVASVHWVDVSFGNKVEDQATIIGLLVAIIYYFARPVPPLI